MPTAFYDLPAMSSPLPTNTIVFSGSSSDSPDDGGVGMQRGASYFFGFLITFVVLLFVFVGCGVVSRRRFAQRRRAMFEWNMEPWAERMQGGEVGYVPPVLMEKKFERAKDASSWKDLTVSGLLLCVFMTTKLVVLIHALYSHFPL